MIIIPESWLYVLFMYVFPIYLACIFLVLFLFIYQLKTNIDKIETKEEALSLWLGSLWGIMIAPLSIVYIIIRFIIKVVK